MSERLMGESLTREMVPLNLYKVTPSRKALRPGDIFAVHHLAGWLFGRVMLVDVPREHAPFAGSNLVYIYACVGDGPEPPIARLTRDALLLPPLWISRLGWSRGAMMTVDHRPLEPGDWLRRHCFDAHMRRSTFYDERGNRRWWRTEPCGSWALYGYMGLDSEISKSLGVPRAGTT